MLPPEIMNHWHTYATVALIILCLYIYDCRPYATSAHMQPGLICNRGSYATGAHMQPGLICNRGSYATEAHRQPAHPFFIRGLVCNPGLAESNPIQQQSPHQTNSAQTPSQLLPYYLLALS